MENNNYTPPPDLWNQDDLTLKERQLLYGEFMRQILEEIIDDYEFDETASSYLISAKQRIIKLTECWDKTLTDEDKDKLIKIEQNHP